MGLDHTGAYYVYEHNRPIKVYIAVTTCLATKGVLLNLTRDIGTNSVIQTVHRLATERGMPRKIFTDNACEFRTAER